MIHLSGTPLNFFRIFFFIFCPVSSDSCPQDISRTERWQFKFVHQWLVIMCRWQTNIFNDLVTLLRHIWRHFLNISWLELNQMTELERINFRSRINYWTYARVKILKCSNWLSFKFIIRFRPFSAFQYFARMYARARVFAHTALMKSENPIHFT